MPIDPDRPGFGRVAKQSAGVFVFLAILIGWRPDAAAAGAPPGIGDPWVLVVVAALTALMAAWWMTETVPIPVTSLLPMVVLPVLAGSAFSMGDVAANYANWRVYLFFGGFLIAIAMESCNLHRRMALLIIRAIGTGPRRVVLGFMVATAFLSMWISNTATALMMLPIALAVVGELSENRRFGIALMLGIAYGASIGGIGTLIGTPPNISFGGVLARLYPDAPQITFARWMALGIPLVVILLPIVWAILVRRLPRRGGDARDVIAAQIRRLGVMKPAERRVLAVFAATAMLWVFRRPIDVEIFRIPGWSEIPGLESANDGVVALAMGLSLFLIPSGRGDGRGVLRWGVVAEKMPWGILLLFGGGFALAAAIGGSGLSAFIGARLGFLAGFHPLALIATCAFVLTFLTEVTSNTATAEIMLPLVAGIAVQVIEIDPLAMMIPVTIAASCAFMLPVATPPNAVVFASGMVPMREMIRYGVVLNMIGVMIVSLLVYLLLPIVFGVDFGGGVPDWALPR